MIDENNINSLKENIYALKSNRTDSKGNEYVYTNYEVFIPYTYLEYIGVTDTLYLYYVDGIVYITSTVPDGSVPAKRLSVHTQGGSPTMKRVESKGENDWKRFFILPKMFFPYVDENQKVLFTLNPMEHDRFSGKALLTIELL